MSLYGDLSFLAMLFALLLACTTISPAGSSTPLSTPPPYSSASICPSRTINFITETLPQQCLRTSWTSNATADEAKHGTATTTDRAGQEVGGQALILAQSDDQYAAARSSIQPSQRSSTEAPQVSTSTQHPVASTTSSSPPAQTNQEQDADPLSDNANFLSFEEWKAQMLRNAGQSPDHVGGVGKAEPRSDTRQRPGAINQALDYLGDDTEIDIDFTGFVNSESVSEALPPSNMGGANRKVQDDMEEPVEDSIKRSQAAGTTSKERFNYASFDCAATVLKSNQGCKGPASILVENKDSYMLNACSVDNKFLIVELCNDILIDTIALGNYEFFSSTFRTFRVSISDRYPVKVDKWRELGTFEAQNSRGVQAFLIRNGLIWARYLRVEFLSHYGNEYYCPVSLLRVHGKTMMDDYRNDVKIARGEDDLDEATVVPAEEPVAIQEPASRPITINTAEENTAKVNRNGQPSDVTVDAGPKAPTAADHRVPSSFNDTCPRTNYPTPLLEQAELLTAGCHKTRRFCNQELTLKVDWLSRKTTLYATTASVEGSAPMNTTPETPSHLHKSKGGIDKQPGTMVPSSLEDLRNATTSAVKSKQEPSTNSSNLSPDASTDTASQTSSKVASQPPSPVPTTQESFFKSVHKRLQLLEANSTLSLQYIEEQSRILREAFTKVEKRQLGKTTTFLEALNITVLSELREFRLQYDQIWQSTILELSSQREQSQREAIALSSRLSILADEVLWQKRLVYLQFGLIFICLGLIFLFRNPVGANSSSTYLDLPLLQNMMSRSSPASLNRYHRRTDLNDSPPATPSRPISSYGLFSGNRGNDSHTRSTSEDTTKSPSIDYQAPTPPSEDDNLLSVRRAEAGGRESESPEPELLLRRAVSSPMLGQDGTTDEGSDEAERNPVASASDAVAAEVEGGEN